MKMEFHIFARKADTQYIVKGVGEGCSREFPSLFEAARHARSLSGVEGGSVVIYDEEDAMVNRIPFGIPSA